MFASSFQRLHPILRVSTCSGSSSVGIAVLLSPAPVQAAYARIARWCPGGRVRIAQRQRADKPLAGSSASSRVVISGSEHCAAIGRSGSAGLAARSRSARAGVWRQRRRPGREGPPSHAVSAGRQSTSWRRRPPIAARSRPDGTRQYPRTSLSQGIRRRLCRVTALRNRPAEVVCILAEFAVEFAGRLSARRHVSSFVRLKQAGV